MNKNTTFTTLSELKAFLNTLTEDELNAQTNEVDWFEIYTMYSRGSIYYHIEGYNGGDE